MGGQCGVVEMVSRDTRWLEQRRQTWYAVIYVPAPLQAALGSKLRKSLGTRDLMEAQRRRFGVLAEFRRQIENATRTAPEGRDPLIDVALNWRGALNDARLTDEGTEAAEGEETGGQTALVEWLIDDHRERLNARGAAGNTFAAVAHGRGTPLLLHVPDWLHEGGQKGAFEPRTKVQHERTLVELQGWMGRVKLAPTIEAVGRREAGRFVTECLGRSGRQPKTIARIISACRSYWTFLLRKGIVPGDKNPWDGQAPPKGLFKGTAEETERPFTDDEVRRLLAGPADAELADLMRVAALTGMRIEEIYRLEVRDCSEGWFNIRKSKTRAGIRKVPVHAAIASIVASRSQGKSPKAYLFEEGGALKEGRERSMAASKRFGHYRKRDGVGVDEVAGGKRRSLVNFHSFRRWFVTAATRAGQAERVVGQIVGHKAQGMTMGVYFGGDLPEQLRACIDAVSLPAGSVGVPQIAA